MKKEISAIKKSINDLKYIIKFDVRTPERETREFRTALNVIGISAVVCFIATILNIYVKSWIMAIVTLSASIVFFISRILLPHATAKNIVYNVIQVIFGLLFSFFYIYGGNSGFAALWILPVPVALNAIFSFNKTLPLGTYFLVFLVLMSYTPLKELVPYEYADAFVQRFPILYVTVFLLSSRLGINEKKAEIDKILRYNELETAVLNERKKNYENSVRTVTTIVNTMEARDPYTRNHSERVATYSKEIGRRMGFDKEKLNRLYLAGLVHDIGKISLPDVVLNKPRELTDAEWELVKNHPETGYSIVWEYDGVVRGIGDATRYHHERIDGHGYPYGLKGDKIPEFARIVAVADAYDAMTSKRVFKEGQDPEYAKNELLKGRGTQFDGKIVDIFVDMIENHVFDDVNGN